MGQRPGVGLVRRRRRRTALLTHELQTPSANEKERQTWPNPPNGVRLRKSRSRPANASSAPRKGQNIDYKDTTLLRTYISERGKIRARRVTGNCVQHQRDIAIAVKNAREVALLPFTSASR